MAAVYLCRDPQGEAVAVKWADLRLPGSGPEEGSFTPPLLARFDREVRSMTRVQHPGVVRYRDHGTWQGRPYLVMDHIEGSDLRLYAEKLALRPPAERYARTRTIGQALCEAVAALHAVGIVHRDVKPSNVLVDPDGRVVLTDLGVVKDLAESDQTVAGLVVGTVAYAAPEQLEGGRVDPRTDLFGIGATLYVLLTGYRPFEGNRREPHLVAAPPSRWDPEIPADLEAVILRLMAPRPADRYPDAAAAAQALAQPGTATGGLPLAGRGKVVRTVTEALDEVEQTGTSLLIRVRGPQGVGRRWLAGIVRASAARRGLTVVEPGEGSGALVAVQRAASAPRVVVLTQAELPALAGLATCDITLAPLSVAEIRRTVVAAAPLTEAPARVAERLHRWTGGLPALLVPLVEGWTRGARLVLPDEPPLLPALDPYLEGLDLDQVEVLGALSALDVPADLSRIERVACVPPEEALAELARRGIAREVDDRWSLTAALFRVAGLACQADPDGLRDRAAAQVPAPAAAPSGPDPEALALNGRLAQARLAAHHCTAEAQARGDRLAEVHALCVLGQVQLDLGQLEAARRTLANASALAKAIGDEAGRRRSHVLRARAELDAQDMLGSRGRAAAAAALDRVVPLLAGAEQRQDPLDALLLAMWARAAAALGDERASLKAADRALRRLPAVPAGAHGRVCLALARAAALRGDEPAMLQALDALLPEERTLPLLAWEGRRVRARLQAQPLPQAGALGDDLSPDELSALETRW